MNWKKLNLGPLGTNCYICMEENQSVIVDPGGEGAEIIELLRELKLTPIAVLLTHAHFDHIGAVDEISSYYSIPVYLHEAEKEWLSNPNLNGSAFFPVEEVTVNATNFHLSLGRFSIGKFEFEIRHTPGHSPGSVSFIEHEEKLVISGDALFNQGIGRTDLPGGDMDILLDSIENQLYTLGEEYRVLPGHGPETTIGNEKNSNPFIKG